MDLTGWHSFMHAGVPGVPNPFSYNEIEVWREGWPSPVRQRPGEFPEMNAVGLYWRPARACKPKEG